MTKSLINHESLQQFTHGDPEFLTDLSVIFQRSMPQLLSRIKHAITEQDSLILADSAHQLKSQLSYFFCEDLISLAVQLERFAENQNVDLAPKIASELEVQLRHLLEEINELTGLRLSLEED